jgi:hypothetical protein
MPAKKVVKKVLTVEVKAIVDFPSVLSDAIREHGAKRVLKILGGILMLEYLWKTIPPATLLADAADEDNIKAGLILLNAIKNWDALAESSIPLWTKLYSEAEDEKRREDAATFAAKPTTKKRHA